MLTALGDLTDVRANRTAALESHPPVVVFWALGVLVMASAMLAGYGMAPAKTRPWMHMLLYSAVLALAVYVILDLEYPRVGLIRVDTADHFLVDQRNSMH